MGVDAIAYGNDSVKIIEINESLHLTASFLLNLFHFGTGCFFDQLLFLVDVSQVFRYGLCVYTKQLCHSFLCQPKSLIAIIHIHTYITIVILIEDDAMLGLLYFFFLHVVSCLFYRYSFLTDSNHLLTSLSITSQ